MAALDAAQPQGLGKRDYESKCACVKRRPMLPRSARTPASSRQRHLSSSLPPGSWSRRHQVAL
ncbi:hypothetical protein PAHAL_2G375400 [Panicum hallii]|uniref:Uncharacterized protein n=1 Tax=Panicum hallii TaxID=206008 RepID=A0A2T8KRR6_9POAL|nr:hypothetical protein PAHAL_2G375400 [Panicum hallii]